MKVLVLALAGVMRLANTDYAHGQSLTAEASVTTGYSTDEVSAAAIQLRLFGEAKAGIRFFGETAWAGRSEPPAPIESDAFGAAYPYNNRVQIIEAYAERIFRPREALVAVRAGRFRPPFGIHSAGDHAYSGFLRAPLLRYGEYTVLSNHFLEHGADFVVGIPRLTIETAIGTPADVGYPVRRSGLDAVVRVQGYSGPLIVGASHIRTSPTESATLTPGRAHGTGIDVRWMRSGVQLRGEWMTGRPSDGRKTTGWYGDVMIHHHRMGPVTAVARIEQLDYEGGAFEPDELLHRQTIGARVNLGYALALNVNFVHQTGDEAEFRPRALDVAVTWAVRTQK